MTRSFLEVNNRESGPILGELLSSGQIDPSSYAGSSVGEGSKNQETIELLLEANFSTEIRDLEMLSCDNLLPFKNLVCTPEALVAWRVM